jgi:nicotinamide-nucleotide amidase
MANLLKLIEKLKQNKLKVAFAESCTGGLLSATFAAIPGVSEVFLGSVVSYADQVKEDLLKVSPQTLKTQGAVSEQAARQMVEGVLNQFHADLGVAITGIAGPSGGSTEKPVGTVWFAIRGPQFEVVEKKLFAGSRVEIQKKSVEHAINSLLNALG